MFDPEDVAALDAYGTRNSKVYVIGVLFRTEMMHPYRFIIQLLRTILFARHLKHKQGVCFIGAEDQAPGSFPQSDDFRRLGPPAYAGAPPGL